MDRVHGVYGCFGVRDYMPDYVLCSLHVDCSRGVSNQPVVGEGVRHDDGFSWVVSLRGRFGNLGLGWVSVLDLCRLVWRFFLKALWRRPARRYTVPSSDLIESDVAMGPRSLSRAIATFW